MSIIISTESAIVVPGEYIRKYGVCVLPLHIIYDGESFDDGVNITGEDILERYEKNKELPTTSACSIGEYTDYFASLTDGGDEVVHFSMSSEISSTYRNACLAAENIDGVRVIDTRNITAGAGLLVIRACEMAENGFTAKEIARRAEEDKNKIRTSFIIDTLEFLRKGGRCSSLAALGANILGIKPSVEVRDGKMQTAKKFRGKYSACVLKYTASCFENVGEVDTARVFIEHAPGVSPDLVEEIRKEIRRFFKFDEAPEVHTTPTIISHCGPGTVGIQFMVK